MRVTDTATHTLPYSLPFLRELEVYSLQHKDSHKCHDDATGYVQDLRVALADRSFSHLKISKSTILDRSWVDDPNYSKAVALLEPVVGSLSRMDEDGNVVKANANDATARQRK